MNKFNHKLTDKMIDKRLERLLKTEHSLLIKWGYSNFEIKDYDSVRIAYEWLDAQNKITNPTNDPDKHMIERWGGLYVKSAYVIVAADLCPNIKRNIFKLNISQTGVLPHPNRLDNIQEAYSQANYYRINSTAPLYYKHYETAAHSTTKNTNDKHRTYFFHKELEQCVAVRRQQALQSEPILKSTP